MSKTYYNQFRDSQRDKSQNGFNQIGFNSYSKTRPTAARSTGVNKQQSPRSDTFTFQSKANERSPKVSKNNPVQNGFQRKPPRETIVRNSSTPPERRRAGTIRRSNVNKSTQKYLSTPVDELERKPARLASKRNNAYYPSPPDYYQKPAPLPENGNNKPRRMRVANNEYVIHRQTQSPERVYDDHQSVSN
jgi:hypothetical protein